MLVLTQSVVSSPAHLDVKVRVAQGLSRGGQSLVKNLLIELGLLTTGYSTFVPVIQVSLKGEKERKKITEGIFFPPFKCTQVFIPLHLSSSHSSTGILSIWYDRPGVRFFSTIHIFHCIIDR